MFPSEVQKWVTWFKSGAYLLYKVGHNKICAQVGYRSGTQQWGTFTI